MKPIDYRFMVKRFSFSSVIAILRESDLIAKIEETYIDEIALRGFYKARCQLVSSKYKLALKFIKTQEGLIYSYQLYSNASIARWDNEPHYPDIETHPHHYHDKHGNVTDSELCGVPENDLAIVLKRIRGIIA